MTEHSSVPYYDIIKDVPRTVLPSPFPPALIRANRGVHRFHPQYWVSNRVISNNGSYSRPYTTNTFQTNATSILIYFISEYEQPHMSSPYLWKQTIGNISNISASKYINLWNISIVLYDTSTNNYVRVNFYMGICHTFNENKGKMKGMGSVLICRIHWLYV